VVEKIGLAQTVEALREELSDAVRRAALEDIQFPVNEVELEFQVGVTWDAEASGKVRFWVLELGTGGSRAQETVQRVTLKLGPPTDRSGEPIKVARRMAEEP
jgi:hypothetical protein